VPLASYCSTFRPGGTKKGGKYPGLPGPILKINHLPQRRTGSVPGPAGSEPVFAGSMPVSASSYRVLPGPPSFRLARSPTAAKVKNLSLPFTSPKPQQTPATERHTNESLHFLSFPFTIFHVAKTAVTTSTRATYNEKSTPSCNSLRGEGGLFFYALVGCLPVRLGPPRAPPLKRS
jgi:hypothetical protein